MSEALLLYPHQLFQLARIPENLRKSSVFLIEDPLFFTQYPFHKQKLIMQRASMKYYESELKKDKIKVRYVESGELQDSGDIAHILEQDKITHAHVFDVVDDWLSKRLADGLKGKLIALIIHRSPGFLTSQEVQEKCFGKKESFFFSNFYNEQRRSLNILLEDNGKPVGGKWSFDPENRKRMSQDTRPPNPFPDYSNNRFQKEAATYVEEHFADHYGQSSGFSYPVTSEDAQALLSHFISEKLKNYGPYQDAIDRDSSFLFHSALSQAINTGLLCPDDVIDVVLRAYKDGRRDTPLQSVEGFIRQVIGWREYVKIIYELIGRKQRTTNFFKAKRPLPDCFWTGTTGIPPVDDVIKRALSTAYSNHIERLMVMSNFMLLCEIRPDDIYEWFMTMYIDAYDWVMVPNVYGMGLFADGGLIVTKPYISSSNYIRKMSHYKNGPWCEIWDGLYWRFIDKHRSVFENNNRMSFMVRHLEKMGAARLKEHHHNAESFLKGIS